MYYCNMISKNISIQSLSKLYLKTKMNIIFFVMETMIKMLINSYSHLNEQLFIQKIKIFFLYSSKFNMLKFYSKYKLYIKFSLNQNKSKQYIIQIISSKYFLKFKILTNYNNN